MTVFTITSHMIQPYTNMLKYSQKLLHVQKHNPTRETSRCQTLIAIICPVERLDIVSRSRKWLPTLSRLPITRPIQRIYNSLHGTVHPTFLQIHCAFETTWDCKQYFCVKSRDKSTMVARSCYTEYTTYSRNSCQPEFISVWIIMGHWRVLTRIPFKGPEIKRVVRAKEGDWNREFVLVSIPYNILLS